MTNIRTYEHTTTPTLSHSNIRTYEHTTTPTLSHSNIRTFEHSNISPFSHSNIRTFEHSNILVRSAFTLIELMVVLGMIAVLMAAMGVSVAKAQTRAKISKATQETKEMTNAILAFEQYAEGHTLDNYAKGSWSECTESAMAMILGGVKGASGEQVPVLYNAAVRGGKLLDPWGHPYEFMIEKATGWEGTDVPQLLTAPALPNYFRLTDGERQ